MKFFWFLGILVAVGAILAAIWPLYPCTLRKFDDVDIVVFIKTPSGTIKPTRDISKNHIVIIKIKNSGRFNGGIIKWNQVSGPQTKILTLTHEELELRDLSPGNYGFSVKITMGCDEHYSEEIHFEVLFPVAIGFDLGTTWSCVAYVNKDTPTVLHSKGEEICIESIVGFKIDPATKEVTVVVGQEAQKMLHTHPKTTIYQVKRLLGKRFHQVDPKNFRYDITPSHIPELDGAAIIIEFPDGTQAHLLPEEISALILKEMKRLAEEFFNYEITDVVISIPAGSTHSQRRATADAARIAGLNVISLEVEPTLALLALSWSDRSQFGTAAVHILITDFGGGTSDFSIARVWKDSGELRVDVIATGGDQKLGGEDFTHCIAADLVSEVKNHFGETFELTPQHEALLYNVAETTKKQLSFVAITGRWNARFEISGKFFNVVYGRNRFEEKCKPLFDKIKSSLQTLFDDTIVKSFGVTKENMEKVIMVGGSSYIPEIINHVKDFFKETKAQVISPDNKDEMAVSALHAVSLGAACSAAIHRKLARGIALPTNTLPLALGVGVYVKREGGFDEVFSKFFDKHTPYPNSMTRSGFTTLFDNQKQVKIKVYQEVGNSNVITDCDLVGQYDIEVPPYPAGEVKIKIIFSLTESGLLKVTAIPDKNMVEQQAQFHVADKEGCLFEDQLANSQDKINKLSNGVPVGLPPPEHKSPVFVEIHIDIAFVLDITGSMGGWIKASKEQIMQMVKDITWRMQNSFTNSNFLLRVGFVGYRDKFDVVPMVKMPLTDDLNKVSDFIIQQNADGGQDTEEDVLGGLQNAVDLVWHENAQKFIVLIGDAPSHDYQEADLISLLKQMKERNFKFAFVHMTTLTDGMLKLFQENFGDVQVIELGSPEGLGFKIAGIVFNGNSK